MSTHSNLPDSMDHQPGSPQVTDNQLQTPSALDTLSPSNLSSLYHNTVLMDVTLDVRGEMIPAHKVILSMKSGFFKKAFLGTFKEAQSKVMSLDEDPEFFKVILRLMYDEEYHHPYGEFDSLFDVYKMATKYELPKRVVRLLAAVYTDAIEHFSVIDLASAISRAIDDEGYLGEYVAEYIARNVRYLLKDEAVTTVMAAKNPVLLKVCRHIVKHGVKADSTRIEHGAAPIPQ